MQKSKVMSLKTSQALKVEEKVVTSKIKVETETETGKGIEIEIGQNKTTHQKIGIETDQTVKVTMVIGAKQAARKKQIGMREVRIGLTKKVSTKSEQVVREKRPIGTEIGIEIKTEIEIEIEVKVEVKV